MVGGRLRCLGSLTHLKAKFGDGYQVDLKLIQPSEADVADTTKRLRRVVPSGGLREAELQQACDTLGDGSRRAMITETDPAGCGLWHILNLNGSIPIADFATVRIFPLRFNPSI
jgi:ATP-binding cassette subfamily A (ABC1) protein 1